ncbi:MAG: hypothetical protein PHD20_06095, partial [Clostridia bacterium]|nr:hypothetical protein [Clostridia bacterium]
MNKKEGRKYMGIILICVYMILTVSGLVFIKLGGNPGTFAMKNGDINFAMNWISAIGFICYI